MKKGGYTAVELLVVLGIMTLLLAVTVPSLMNSYQRYQLDTFGEDLAQALRLAQEKAMMSESNSVYSVHLVSGAGGAFTIVRGSTYASRDTAYDEVHTLPGGFALSTTTPDADVNFTKVEGSTSDTGTITITWTDSGLTRAVQVNETGRVDVQ